MFNSFISKAGKKRGLGVHVIYYLVICNYYYLKDDAMKVLHSICWQIWKTAVAAGLEKVSFHSNPKERQCQRMLKLLHNCTHLTRMAQLVKNPPAMQETQVNSWVGKIHWRRERLPTPVFLGFPCGPAGKESTCNVGDLGLIPGLGRSPREGKGYPLQYSGLENSMECIVHGVTKSQTRLSNFHFTSLTVTVATVLAKTLTVILAFKTRKPRTTMTQLLVTGAANYVIPMCSLIQVIICGVCWKALSLSLRWAHSEHKELLMCATRAQSLPSTVSWDSWAP